MGQRFVVIAAAWLEIVVGVAFITMPAIPCALLFAAAPEGLGIALARWVGVGLLALGIACLPSTIAGPHRSAVLGLTAFNIGICVLLAWVGIATANHGFLLWPVVILHSVIATALVPQLLTNHAPTNNPV